MSSHQGTSPRKGQTVAPPRPGPGNLTQDAQRDAILTQLDGEVIECSTGDWFQAYAPFAVQMDTALLEAILASLRTADDHGDILLDDHTGWLKFHEVKGEVEAFRTFEDVVARIVKIAQEYDPEKYAEPTTIDNASASIITTSEVTRYRFFSDWIFSLVNPSERPTSARQLGLRRSPRFPVSDKAAESEAETGNSALLAEFKREDTDKARLDNEKKIVGGITEILYNDPRRASAVGFTIEASCLCMWHFSRSHVARSQKTNIDKNPHILIRFFFFALFAPLEDLGFDPTVTRHFVSNPDWEGRYSKPLEEHKIVYRYTVTNADHDDHTVKIFQTFGNPISEDSTYHIVSRATRVWIATEVTGDKSPDEVDSDARGPDGNKLHKVLKDVWLYEGGPTEREIQSKIMNGIEEEARGRARHHFLQIDLEGFVDGKNSPTPQCNGWWDVEWVQLEGFVKSGLSTRVATQSSAQPKPDQRQMRIHPGLHPPRRHHRTVFAEVCKNVYELEDFGEFFNCALGVVKGLYCMKKAGYVHRDASAGNSLLYTDPETGVMTGKVSDMEYASSYESFSTNNPKTGTPDFMATEYQSLEYFYLPPPPPPTKNPQTLGLLCMLDDSESNVVMPMLPSQPSTTLVFIPNFLHDLESVVWQYLWLLHFRVPATLVEDEDDTSLAKYRAFIRTIKHSRQSVFSQGIHGSIYRRRLIKNIDDGKYLTIHLEKLYGKASTLLRPLALLNNLRQAYTWAEEAKPENMVNDDGTVMVDEEGEVLQRLPSSAFDDTLYTQMIRIFNGLKDTECPLRDINEWKEALDKKAAPATHPESTKRTAAAMEGDDTEKGGLEEPPQKARKT